MPPIAATRVLVETRPGSNKPRKDPMALLEAEPFRDLAEIWIGLRSDGNKGSGRADDPIHAGVLLTAPVRASLSVFASSKEILVTTPGSHGLVEGDLILLSDTRDVPGAPAASYDGPSQVTVKGLAPNQFKCFLDLAASATFNGFALIQKRILLLDQVLRSLTQEGLSIRFGPGVFETRGNT